MIRDGSERHQLLRALMAAGSGRGSPAYTAYATPILLDVAENLQLLPAQADDPSTTAAAATGMAYTFTGSMSLARLEAWVEYVEGNLLRECPVSVFPDCVRDWDAGIALGQDPRTPLPTDQGDRSFRLRFRVWPAFPHFPA